MVNQTLGNGKKPNKPAARCLGVSCWRGQANALLPKWLQTEQIVGAFLGVTLKHAEIAPLTLIYAIQGMIDTFLATLDRGSRMHMAFSQVSSFIK